MMHDDALDDVWYQGGLRFECTQCGNCCSGPSTGYVWVDDEEIVALATAYGMAAEIDAFERKFVRKVGLKKSLVEYSDGDCIFLEPNSRRCLLYAARPRQCRSWPFWEKNLATPKSWAQASSGCPGCNRGPLYSIETIQSRKTLP